MTKPLLTVCICTYNRQKLLELCIESLLRQLAPTSLFEVLIVDNGSDDGTVAFLESVVRCNSHLRWFEEPKQGLSHARNKGWLEAAGTYVAFIDDDAIAETDWVKQIALFSESHPEIAVFGGPYESFTLNQPPTWFPPEYGNWKLEGGPRSIKFGAEWLCGTNMVFRKEILREIGGFSVELGMSGTSVAYGEETELFSKIAKINIPMYYVPSMKVYHLILDYKMSLRWLLMSSYKRGAADGRLLVAKYPVVLDIAFLVVFMPAKSVYTFFKTGTMPLKRKFYYSLLQFYAELGRISARLDR